MLCARLRAAISRFFMLTVMIARPKAQVTPARSMVLPTLKALHTRCHKPTQGKLEFRFPKNLTMR